MTMALSKDKHFITLNNYLTWLEMLFEMYCLQFEALESCGFLLMRRSNILIELKASTLDVSLRYSVAEEFLQCVGHCKSVVRLSPASPNMWWFTVESNIAVPRGDPSPHLIDKVRSLVVTWNEKFRRLANVRYNKKIQRESHTEGAPPGREPREFDVFALFSKLYVPIMSGIDKSDGF
jgi:hypothetical protein